MLAPYQLVQDVFFTCCSSMILQGKMTPQYLQCYGLVPLTLRLLKHLFFPMNVLNVLKTSHFVCVLFWFHHRSTSWKQINHLEIMPWDASVTIPGMPVTTRTTIFYPFSLRLGGSQFKPSLLGVCIPKKKPEQWKSTAPPGCLVYKKGTRYLPSYMNL